MALTSDTLAYQELQRSSVAWRLLRAQNAPFIVAILDAHFGEGASKLTVPELVEAVDTDLEELRERLVDFDMERSAKEYCEQWRHDGYLVRRPASEGRIETYELSSGALAAIDLIKSLARPHRTVTQSRLSTIIDRIGSLSLATDTNRVRRRAALLHERECIDEQIARLDAGEVDVLDEQLALEQARDIVSLAREIPRDFVSVSDEFERISHDIYTKLLSCSEGYQDALEDIFAGVDQIGQSAPGRSFSGFYELLRDIGASESLQDEIDAILDAEFSLGLELEERRFLRRLLRTFLEQGREVNETKTSLARGLRRLVQSQSFQQERVLKRVIDRSLARAGSLALAYRLTDQIGVDLELTSTPIAPVSRYELRNPDDSFAEPIEQTEAAESRPMSIEELRAWMRSVEIDFDELTSNVNACRAEAKGRPVSIGEVLGRFPATQGAASVVGLLMLALDQGRRGAVGETEMVSWKSAAGIEKRAEIACFAFGEDVQ